MNKCCENCDNLIVINMCNYICDVTGTCTSKNNTCYFWSFSNKKINILNI